jgi:hypothetical protein
MYKSKIYFFCGDISLSNLLGPPGTLGSLRLPLVACVLPRASPPAAFPAAVPPSTEAADSVDLAVEGAGAGEEMVTVGASSTAAMIGADDTPPGLCATRLVACAPRAIVVRVAL